MNTSNPSQRDIAVLAIVATIGILVGAGLSLTGVQKQDPVLIGFGLVALGFGCAGWPGMLYARYIQPQQGHEAPREEPPQSAAHTKLPYAPAAPRATGVPGAPGAGEPASSDREPPGLTVVLLTLAGPLLACVGAVVTLTFGDPLQSIGSGPRSLPLWLFSGIILAGTAVIVILYLATVLKRRS